jgi:hypothetical protein
MTLGTASFTERSIRWISTGTRKVPRKTHEGEMATDDGVPHKSCHLTVHAVLLVRERPPVYPTGDVFLDEADHACLK